VAGPVAQPLLSQQTKKTITKLRYRPQACPVPSAIIHREFLVKTCGKYGGKRSGCHLFSGLTSRNGSKGHHHGTAFTRAFLKSDIVDLCDSLVALEVIPLFLVVGPEAVAAGLRQSLMKRANTWTSSRASIYSCQIVSNTIVLIMDFMEDQAKCPEVQVA